MIKKILILFCLFLISGCATIKKGAVNTIAPIIPKMSNRTYREADINKAKASIPEKIDLLKKLLKSSPNNYNLLTSLAQANCGYALLFVVDEDLEKAKSMYIDGRDYGLRALKLNKKFAKASEVERDFANVVKYSEKKEVGALFWTGNCWANYVNLTKAETKTLFDIPKVKAIMSRVLELDETFYYGGAHLFFGGYYAGLPEMGGGGAEKSKIEFEKVFEISENKFLLAHLYYARYYATLIKDEKLFDDEIQYVLSTPSDINPDLTLANQVTKEKAQRLLAEKEKYF